MKRTILGPVICWMCLVCLSPAAQAALVIVSSVGGQPASGVNYATFNGIPLGSGGGVDGAITVTFNPDAAAVTGASSGLYAAPFLSNGNGANFGGQPDGADGTTYLTTGSTGAFLGSSVTLQFSGYQQYLGLLWGSVDLYNTLEFFDGATSLGTIGGGAINPTATGDQGINGTFYVNINSDTPFDRVVATSTAYAFEFDNVAYAATQIPEPASVIVWSMLGLAVAGAGWWRRRQAAID